MQINITARDFGGTEFLAQPHRLHLGAQKAEGVDRLEFSLPEQWNGCVVTLHIRHADGTLAEPLALDETGCVSVGRSFTGWASGEWMLAAANGNGYTAYTRPGQYDVHGILPTEGAGEELTPSVYEQFIARVMASANAAAEAAKRAASGEANAKQSASKAASSAQQTAASATLAAGYAEQAEAAADRAAAYAPSEGAVLSVNGKGGTVRLNALDVWALPRPVSPKAGQLVRVVNVDASTGALTADTINTDSLSGLGSEEKALLLKLLNSASYTDSSARDDLEALKKLWDTTPPTPLPDPDIIPVEKVTLSRHTLELSRGSTADLSASVAPPDATDQTVLWSVSPTDIVSVDAGRVTALKKGSAVVTATSDSKSDSCTVTVTPAVYRIETAHTDSGDIPAWDTYPAKAEFFMPLTAKKAGLLLRSLEFRVKGYVPGTMRTVLRKYGSTTALADKFIDIVRGYNDVVLDMGSIALEKGVEYQLYFAASNNFYPPSVTPGWVVENDYVDIATGSAYYGGDTTLIFSGTMGIVETHTAAGMDGATTDTLTVDWLAEKAGYQQVLNGAHTLTLIADDGKTSTDWTATFTKNVTSAVLSLAQPLTADDTITVAALTLEGSFSADMSLTVEMTNNARDDAPVWENCTDIQRGESRAFAHHAFTNKTAAKGAAFNYKVTITRGESGVGGNITMIGGVIG